MNLFSIFPFSSFLINTILASVVLALNPHGKTNRAYALFAYSFAFWAFLNFIVWNGYNPTLFSVAKHIEPFCWLPSTLLVLNFIFTLIKRKRDWVFWGCTGIVVGWTSYGAVTGCMIVEYQPVYWGNYAVMADCYFPAVVMATLVPAVYCFYLLISTIQTTKEQHFRTQLMYLTIGSMILFLLVFIDSVLRTSLLRMTSLPFLGSFYLIVQSGFVFFAIVRHRFLQVDLRDAAHEVFAHVNDGVILLDLNGSVRDMNRAACSFFGVATEAPIENLSQLFGTSYRFAENAVDWEIVREHDGITTTGLLSQSDLLDRGRLIGKLVIVHDATQQRKEAQERLELELKVRQSHASRLEAMGQLAGGVAHDFNNMLAGMYGFADLLRMKLKKNPDCEPKLLLYAENILRSVRQAADLTKKLTMFARRNVSEMKTFNVHDAIMDTIALLEHTIDKRVDITSDLTAERCVIRGDRAQIQNMLLNIAINAGDAMPEGGALLFKTTYKEFTAADARCLNKDAEGGSYLVVAVADTGVGMSAEVQREIFNPFFTTKKKGKGTGLGLASAYGIAVNHKGFVTVESEVGKGTTFYACFPLSSKELPPAESSVKVAAPEVGQGRILLADDEEYVRESATEMLLAIGYTVIPCDNGAAAVAWYTANQGNVDLVILDVMMPKMTGDQCALALQKINPGVKLLFISGYSSTLSAERWAELTKAGGDVTIMQKPFTIEQLAEAVRRVMGN